MRRRRRRRKREEGGGGGGGGRERREEEEEERRRRGKMHLTATIVQKRVKKWNIVALLALKSHRSFQGKVASKIWGI